MHGIVELAEVVFVDGSEVPVAHKHGDHMVVLRDANDPDGVALYYTPDEWEAFVLGVKDGEFDDMVDLASGSSAPPSSDQGQATDRPAGEPRAFPWTGRPGLLAGDRGGA